MENATRPIERPSIISVVEKEGVSWPKPLREAAQKIIDDIPGRYQIAYARALSGKLSPRQAIKMKCVECCGFEDAIERVRDCRTYRCPLWQMRPFQTEAEESDNDPS